MNTSVVPVRVTSSDGDLARFGNFDWAMAWMLEQINGPNDRLQVKKGHRVLFDTIRDASDIDSERAKYGV
jgi:hypothetical protein